MKDVDKKADNKQPNIVYVALADMIGKIRPNVWFVDAGLILMTCWLYSQGFKTEALYSTVAVGIVTLLGAVAQDPPPPTVPASIHEKTLDVFNKFLDYMKGKK